MNVLSLTLAAGTATPTLEWNLCSYFIKTLGVEGTTTAGWITVISVLLCIIVPYLLGSVNPAIIFSKLIYHEDIRSFGSGNAGSTNVLRTYGVKMAALIFTLDLCKAAIAVGFGWFVLTRSAGGAIAALFVVLGHMFPVFYKFKGGKGVACTAACILMLSPISFAILFVVFMLIALMTRFISLGSIICVMLFPLLAHAFRGSNDDAGFIPMVALLIGALVVFMHRENIKRLLAGKESKFSFKKTDKHASSAHDAAGASQSAISASEEKEHSDDDFIKCECGRIIPKTREKCVYCGAVNKSYVLVQKGSKGKKKK